MADAKISALTELTTAPASTDLIPIVDVSDTSMAASGTTKYITSETLLSSQGKYEIETITADGSTITKFDFQSIPSTYRRLWIHGYVEGDVAATTEALYIFFNNDTTATNYYRQYSSHNATSVTTSEGAEPRIALIAGANAVGASMLEICIEGYAATLIQQARGQSQVYRTGGSDVSNHQCVVFHDSATAAINRVTLQADGDPTNVLIGTLTLYGEN